MSKLSQSPEFHNFCKPKKLLLGATLLLIEKIILNHLRNRGRNSENRRIESSHSVRSAVRQLKTNKIQFQMFFFCTFITKIASTENERKCSWRMSQELGWNSTTSEREIRASFGQFFDRERLGIRATSPVEFSHFA